MTRDGYVRLMLGTAATATGLAFLAVPVAAQQAPAATSDADRAAEPERGVGDIVVTARKRAETSNTVGMSISAFAGDQLVQQGVTDTAQLVKIVPGFNYTRSAYGTPVYTLRGIGFNETSLAASPTVSVYVDEVPLPYSIMTAGAGLDLERVEVLKGPQGTLFGQNSTGGAINYIAAKPTATPQAGFDLSVGRFSQVETNAYVSGPLGDTLRARVAVHKEYADPWQVSASRPADRLGGVDRVQARLLLDWTPTDRLSFGLNVNGWQDRSDSQAGQLVGLISTRAPATVRTQPLTIGSARRADWDPNTNFLTHDNFWQAALRANYELGGNANLTSITAYEKLTRSAYVDADGTPVENFAALNAGYIKTFSQELRLAGTIAPALEGIVGGNYQHDDTDDLFQPHATESSFPFDVASAVGRNKVNTYAGFANLDWKVASQVTLTGGVRYTWQNRDYSGCLYDSGAGDLAAVVAATSTRLSGTTTTIARGACVTLNSTTFKPEVYRASLNQGNVSWKGGVNWQVDPRTLLYATVSKGYKNGVFITTGATFAAQLAPATQESVQAYEAGFKLGLFNHAVQLNGAGFYYDYRDKQIRGRVIDPVLGGLNKLINIPKSRIAGAEVQLIWEIVAGLRFNGGATYVGSRILGDFTNFTPLGTQTRMSGEAFPLTPKWQLTGDLQYDVPLSATLNAFVGVNASHQAKTNAALGNEPLFDIDAYTLVDLRAGFHGMEDRWRVTGFVNNVGDTYYWSNVAFNGPDAAIRYAGRPRTYGVRLSFRYR